MDASAAELMAAIAAALALAAGWWRTARQARALAARLETADLSARRSLDAQLAQKQEILNLIVAASQAGYLEHRPNTGDVAWSPRLREMLGVPSDEVVHWDYFRLNILPEDLPEYLLRVTAFAEGKGSFDAEVRVRHRAGHYVWLHARGVREFDSDGRHVRNIGFVLDISDRMEAQRALAESERKFRNLIEGAMQGVAILRRNRAIFCNGAYARMLGYDSVEKFLSAPSHIDHRAPENNDESDLYWDAALSGQLDGKIMRRRVLTRTGQELWADFVGRMISWEGEPAWQVAVIEVTEQKRIEDELRASEERFRFLATHASDLLVHYDDERRLIYVSPSAERITGYTLDEWYGFRSFEMVHPEDVDALREMRSIGASEARFGAAAVWRLRHKEGRLVWMESQATLIPTDDGHYQVLAAARDVTERVEREAEIRRTHARLQQQADELVALARNLERERQRAEQANLAKSQFLAMMSHELRTPLTGVIGMADLLLLSGLNDEQDRVTKLLSRSARVLLDLLNDVLDFSKIEAGQLDIERVAFSLSDVIDEVASLHSTAIGDKGLQLDIEVAPGVRDAVVGDPKRLRQVLSNLLSNAVKFTHQGRITVRVTMDERTAGQLVLKAVVQDTGIGIAAADAAKLFQPFVQADLSTSRQYGGSGLGLAICKRLVNAMGGDITLQSVPSQGSTFTFTVCLVPATAIADAEAERVVPPPPVQTRALNILIAEDNDTTRYLLAAMLTRLGHRTTAVADGRQAADACRDGDFDVVLMDMQMPVMDGTDATRCIRDLAGPIARVPIIALTADALPEHRSGFLAAGTNAVVVKPVAWRELGEVMEELVPGAGIAAQIDRSIAQSADLRPADADAAGTDTLPIVDGSMLDDLASALGDKAVANMLPTFVANMVEYRDRLAAAISAEDLAEAKRAAHAMKGLAAQFGAPRVSAIARIIEQDALTIAEVSTQVRKLVSAVAATAQAIRARTEARASAGEV